MKYESVLREDIAGSPGAVPGGAGFEEEFALAILAGIDEAGLGPVLGPLVVSTSAFRLDDALRDQPLWDTLSEAVARKPVRRSSRIAIGDSKKLFVRSKDNALEHLERAVLGMLAGRGHFPPSLKESLQVLAPGVRNALPHYPWYAESDLPLPHCISDTDRRLAGNALAVALRNAGVELVAMRSEIVMVGEFNRHVAATDNKATMLFDIASRLMDYLWRKMPPEEKLYIHVDRLGGRCHYLPGLQRVFEGGQFRILDETETHSAYEVRLGGRYAEVHFSTRGEERHLAVALASMTSKYFRELFMELFNRFWAGHVEGIKPTAGYYTDGRRFYQEIEHLLPAMNFAPTMIYRDR